MFHMVTDLFGHRNSNVRKGKRNCDSPEKAKTTCTNSKIKSVTNKSSNIPEIDIL